MTKREMFEAIVNGNITEEVIAMAQKELNKDSEKLAQKSAEHAAVDAAVIDALKQATELATAKEITATIGKAEITRGKVVASLTRLSAAGKVTRVEGNVYSYRLA
jgi:predicted Rossmann fold nucleotide-binding protein DprA/Smf involved in DNA uptake